MRKFLYSTHRVLGALFNLLMLMWFLSGFVMMYYGFPRFSEEERRQWNVSIDTQAMPTADSVRVLLARHGIDTLQALEYSIGCTLEGESYWQITQRDSTIRLNFQGEPLSHPRLNTAYYEAVAKGWQERVSQVDTLADLDQWTPFQHLRGDLPFYRLRLSGEEDRWVYLSSHNGRILTDCTRAERAWAWVGAIPHWIYPTVLRQDRDLWISVVTWLSGIASFMVLTGLYVGIDAYWKSRKQRRKRVWASPYKWRYYRWHHALGTLSGVFIFAWVFSGLMSVQRLPSWVTGIKDDAPPVRLSTKKILLSSIGDGTQALHLLPHAQELTAERLGDKTLLHLVSRNSSLTIDATTMRPLHLQPEEALHIVQSAYGVLPKGWTELTAYDTHYIDRRGKLPLPVYKIEVGDADEHIVYLHPYTGKVRALNRADRMNHWTYRKLHTMAFPCLVARPWLWTLVMWVLLGMGTVVSFTGVWMGFNFLRRKWRQRS